MWRHLGLHRAEEIWAPSLLLLSLPLPSLPRSQLPLPESQPLASTFAVPSADASAHAVAVTVAALAAARPLHRRHGDARRRMGRLFGAPRAASRVAASAVSRVAVPWTAARGRWRPLRPDCVV